MRNFVRALGIGVSALGLAGCWPVPGHDADRSGYDDLETAITPETVGSLEESWTWSGAPSLYGPVESPVVSAGGVHLVTGCGLVTIDVTSGAERWRVELPTFPEVGDGWPCDGMIRQAGDPFVIGDAVHAGMVFRIEGRPPPTPAEPIFDTATGSWDVATGEPVPGELLPGAALEARRDDVVAGLAGRGDFTGTPPFLTPYIATWPELGLRGETPRALPVSSDGRMTIGTGAAYVVTGTSLTAFAVHDPQLTCGSGTTECPLWTATLDGPIVGRPVVGAGGTRVYVGTGAGTVHALDAATGAVSWRAAVGSAVAESSALAHGTLYVPTAAGDLVAVPAGGCGAATCAPAWSASTGSTVDVQPVVAGEVVLTGSDDGALRAFDAAGCGAATCSPLWSASTGNDVTALAVSGGTLYAGTADTRLIAYRLAG